MRLIFHQLRRCVRPAVIPTTVPLIARSPPARHCSYTNSEEVDAVLDAGAPIASLQTVCRLPGMGHRVLAVQPNVRRGREKLRTSEALRKLHETVALIQTLPSWRVVENRLMNTDNPRSERVFGPGNLSDLAAELSQRHGDISALYIGIDMLTVVQKHYLQALLQVPVFDRYSIVLQIFKEHAQSRVAKLQVALAEIPYVRSGLGHVSSSASTISPSIATKCIGGSGETYLSEQRMLLNGRESRIKVMLQKIKESREKVRESRKRAKHPTIAVVGYTNSGKTSVIQALTHDESLQPKDELFATVDVTAHAGALGAGNMPVLYIDTVGFISDIPTTLIESFSATLEDAVHADVLVHVCDVSNPEYVEQREHVMKTLEQLQVENLNEMIEAFNKIDKCDDDQLEPLLTGTGLMISALSGDGMDGLKDAIEELVMRRLGRQSYSFRIPIVNDAQHLSWLYKHSTLVGTDVCTDTDTHLLATVIMDEFTFNKFTTRFGTHLLVTAGLE